MTSHFGEPVAVYFSHIMAILFPGRPPRMFSLKGAEPSTMEGWLPQDLERIIDLGFAQMSRQRSDLEAIRGRAQFALTTNILIFGASLTMAATVSLSLFSFIVWCIGVTAILLGMLGAAGVLVARKDLGMVDTVNMSHQDPDNLSVLARAVVNSIKTGEISVATNITVFWYSAALSIYGVLISALAFVLAVR